MEENNQGELQDIKEQLAEMQKLARDNNKILRHIQRSAYVGIFFRILYWALIIGSMLGLYYYLQPFLDNIVETFNVLISVPEKIKGLDLQSLPVNF
ncbi:hypothetical protein KJ973_01140 [Patescibacteria group bacterium]|nr:hypothetical protein [Patescibacteria group bacterium]MBU1519286.1 hypothetical protein [Patescibacteria group bacterium]MBU2416834.1 hypothetical protein [Patescibacteria group bacterium]MBU2460759.1 hypothetical protein [Patescibacteria group bacterium]